MKFHRAILGACVSFGLVAGTASVVNSRDTGERTVWLDAHNQERTQFGSQPLRWSTTLENEAREWAEVLARSNRLEHSPRETRGRQGENLWMGTKGRFAPHQMIEAFADEKQHFKAGEFPNVSTTGRWSDVGHFTQIVWHDTREVGCASAQGPEFDVLVCRYFPGGNVIGTYLAPASQVARR